MNICWSKEWMNGVIIVLSYSKWLTYLALSSKEEKKSRNSVCCSWSEEWHGKNCGSLFSVARQVSTGLKPWVLPLTFQQTSSDYEVVIFLHSLPSLYSQDGHRTLLENHFTTVSQYALTPSLVLQGLSHLHLEVSKSCWASLFHPRHLSRCELSTVLTWCFSLSLRPVPGR